MSQPFGPGEPAPDFSLTLHSGISVTLAHYAGRRLVLYFYPKDDTPGCTRQALDFSAAREAFEARHTAILGVSRDPVAKHAAFRAKHALSIDLASDPAGEACAAYGTWVEKTLYGRKSMGIERSTFLISPEGHMDRIWRKLRVPGHVNEVLLACDSRP